ncbi:MAG: alpha/beta hydrolase family protein [Vicinamibacterales bacterium]
MHLILLAMLALHEPALIRPADVAIQAARPALRPTANGIVREESVRSAALGREMKYRVLLPSGYDTSPKRYPVLYLLHGLGGDYTDWTMRTNLAEYSRSFPLIIVMPDGENSWYTNTLDGTSKFEDYMTTDLQADVVRKYRTVNSRYGRSIAGLSMGGYGALKLALKRPAQFAVVGAFSGAFSITQDLGTKLNATDAAQVMTIFGAPESEARKDNDVFLLAAAVKPAGAPYVYVDCGTADGLLPTNREVARAVHKAGLAYEYHEVAGAHTWDYWDRRIRVFLPILMGKLAN